MAVQLQDMIDSITNGTQAERLAWKTKLVQLINAEDIGTMIINGTRQEREDHAKQMRLSIQWCEETEQAAAKATRDAEVATAQTWFDALPLIANPTTREHALKNFRDIEALIKTERNQYRQHVLGKELRLANEKFKQVKAGR